MSPQLASVSISNFRSIRGTILVPLDAPVVLIHGPNGSGKTSILSAIELALTGAVPSLARVEPDYGAQLVHKQAQQARVSMTVTGLTGATEVTLPIASTGFRGRPLLPQRLAEFYSERCYLPQSLLGHLLELYQVPDTRDSDSPLTQFVKDLLGLDQLDALIDGLRNAEDIRRLRAPVPLYGEVRNEIQTTQRAARAENAELVQLRNEIAAAEANLKETIGVIAPDLAQDSLNFEALRSRLNRSAEEQRLSTLARVRRNLDAARNEWQTLAPTEADQRQSLERQAASTRQEADHWRASSGEELQRLLDQIASIFPDLPSSTGTDPEFARTTALRSVEKEHTRCEALLTLDEANTKRVEELDRELARTQSRSMVLDQQIAGLAADAGTLAQALLNIAPYIHTDDCPVCGRDFAEISKRPLNAHVSSRIASLTEDAGRLQALSQEKASLVVAIARTTREKSDVQGRQISAATRNELQQRRAQLTEVRQKLEANADATRHGLALINQAAQSARAVNALRSRDLQITNFRETLVQLAGALAIENVDLNQPVEVTLAFFETTLAHEESLLADVQQRKQSASADLFHCALATRKASAEAKRRLQPPKPPR